MKTGRNDPCPCGSGKKHKRCCLGVVDETEADALTRDLTAFAAPLLEGLPEDASDSAVEGAVQVAAACWKIALEEDDDAREAAIRTVVEHASRSDEERREREQLIRSMIARHRQMFPELHAPDATRPA